MLTELNGQIERITFANEENGFTIAKVKVRDRRDLVTVVGVLMSPMPGEILDMKGEWTSHPKFGEQFKVVEYRTKVPATVYGIRKYLGSGLIKGLGFSPGSIQKVESGKSLESGKLIIGGVRMIYISEKKHKNYIISFSCLHGFFTSVCYSGNWKGGVKYCIRANLI